MLSDKQVQCLHPISTVKWPFFFLNMLVVYYDICTDDCHVLKHSKLTRRITQKTWTHIRSLCMRKLYGALRLPVTITVFFWSISDVLKWKWGWSWLRNRTMFHPMRSLLNTININTSSPRILSVLLFLWTEISWWVCNSDKCRHLSPWRWITRTTIITGQCSFEHKMWWKGIVSQLYANLFQGIHLSHSITLRRLY